MYWLQIKWLQLTSIKLSRIQNLTSHLIGGCSSDRQDRGQRKAGKRGRALHMGWPRNGGYCNWTLIHFGTAAKALPREFSEWPCAKVWSGLVQVVMSTWHWKDLHMKQQQCRPHVANWIHGRQVVLQGHLVGGRVWQSQWLEHSAPKFAAGKQNYQRLD